MNLLMEMMATFQRKNKTGEEIDHITRARLYNRTHNDDLQEALTHGNRP